MWKVLILVATLLSLATFGLGQQRRIEITEADFTKAEMIRSTNLSVFGVYLGQPVREASSAIKTGGLFSKESAGAIEVHDLAGKTLLTLFLVDGTVDSILLNGNLADYLKGDEKKLFSPTIVDPQSSYRMELLGREDEILKNADTDMPEISYVYFKEGIKIQGLKISRLLVSVLLFVPARTR